MAFADNIKPREKKKKGARYNENILVLSSRPRHVLRFISSKVNEYIGHWHGNELVKCKKIKCPYCEKEVPQYRFFITPVIDMSDKKVKLVRLGYQLMTLLAEHEKNDARFKKFYSRKHGRDIIIVVKRSRKAGEKKYEYSIYPGDPWKVPKKYLDEVPEFHW